MDLKSLVRRFEIGEPIKSLFKATFHAVEDITLPAPRIDLRCFVPDAYGKRGVIEINLQNSIAASSDDEEVFHMMRRMLHNMLLHEADEAILVDGQRVYDPHK